MQNFQPGLELEFLILYFMINSDKVIFLTELLLETYFLYIVYLKWKFSCKFVHWFSCSLFYQQKSKLTVVNRIVSLYTRSFLITWKIFSIGWNLHKIFRSKKKKLLKNSSFYFIFTVYLRSFSVSELTSFSDDSFEGSKYEISFVE